MMEIVRPLILAGFDACIIRAVERPLGFAISSPPLFSFYLPCGAGDGSAVRASVKVGGFGCR